MGSVRVGHHFLFLGYHEDEGDEVWALIRRFVCRFAS